MIPEKLFEEPIETKKMFNLKPLKLIGRKNIKINDKQLKEEMAKKVNNPHFFTDSALKVG